MDALRTFLNVVFWEYIQNLPVVLGFGIAVWLWVRDKYMKASVVIASGAVLGAVIIRYTERYLLGRAYMEAWSVTVVNVVGFAAVMLLFTLYLSRETGWSNTYVDMTLGALAGGGFALAQSLAAEDLLLIGIVLHGVSLAVAAAVVLLMLRRVKGQTLTEVVMGSSLATLMMTLIISIIDYSYLLAI
jgi:riboflavin transporter FmnP